MKKIAKKQKTLRVFKVCENDNSYSIELVRIFDLKSNSIMFAVFVCFKGTPNLYAYESDYYVARNYFLRLVFKSNPYHYKTL